MPMKQINEQLAADLLEAGKTEFLAKGFQGASLRAIAATLGVTTGSIYRYYADKEALFDSIVSAPAQELEQRYQEIQESFSALPLDRQMQTLPEVGENGQAWMMRYLYDHFDAFKLIACCSAGTKYEHYIDSLIDVEVRTSRVLIDRLLESGQIQQDIDNDLIHIVSSALFHGIFEPIRHDMPWTKAVAYLDSLRAFYSAGWFRLLGVPLG
jgi:AcrR family transcriptional regulator